MEPPHPELRQALKDAHPGLSDEDIDRIEELNARRFELDPDTDADELRRLEAENRALMERAMPRYREVVTAFTRRRAAAAAPRRAAEDRVRIRIKQPDEGSGEGSAEPVARRGPGGRAARRHASGSSFVGVSAGGMLWLRWKRLVGS